MAKAPETSPSAELAVPIPAIEIAPFGKRPLRTFALFIGLPAFLLYVVSAGLVIMALAGMASEMDRTADQRGITSMHAALDSFLNDLAGTVSDNGTWDEAYLNVVVTPDPAWMDATWGATARLGQTYDNVFVTDQSGAIVFGENGAGPLKGNIVSRLSFLAPGDIHLQHREELPELVMQLARDPALFLFPGHVRGRTEFLQFVLGAAKRRFRFDARRHVAQYHRVEPLPRFVDLGNRRVDRKFIAVAA